MYRMRHMIWIGFLAAIFAAAGAAVAQEDGDPERGGRLYVENCAVCHGVDGKGRVGASLENFPGINVEAALSQTIANGIDGTVMPAWSQANGGPLSEENINDIVAYIREAFGGTEPIQPLPTYNPPDIAPLPEVSGDPSQGAVVFLQNCAMCHGEQGRGRFGAPLAKSWPGNQPEVFIQQVVSTGIEGTIMPAWAMESGGPLDQDQIQDVTAYVLTLQPQPQPTAEDGEQPGPLNLTTSLVILGVLVLVGIVTLVVYYRRA